MARRKGGKRSGGRTPSWLMPLLVTAAAVAAVLVLVQWRERALRDAAHGGTAGPAAPGAPEREPGTGPRGAADPDRAGRQPSRDSAPEDAGASDRDPNEQADRRGAGPASSPTPGPAPSAGDPNWEPAGPAEPAGSGSEAGGSAASQRRGSAERPRTARAAGAGAPRAAIIIDDIGWNMDLARELDRIDLPLTWAVIPHLPHSTEAARLARRGGRDVLVHQPMEADERAADPSRGLLRIGMKEGEVRDAIGASLRSVPYAAGMNNHQGSRATADRRLMRLVLEDLKDRGLFFVDSRTSPRTVALDEAKKLRVPSASRAVFLDEDRTPRAISAQLDRLLEEARRDGTAVGIGHIVPETLAVLQERQASLRDSGVSLVYVSEVVQ